MKIIGVITTKNRYEFFVQAVHSAAKQKKEAGCVDSGQRF